MRPFLRLKVGNRKLNVRDESHYSWLVNRYILRPGLTRGVKRRGWGSTDAAGDPDPGPVSARSPADVQPQLVRETGTTSTKTGSP